MDSLIRYSAPTKFDKAPQFTVCKVIDDDKNETIYVQIGNDPNYGTWMKMNEVVGKILEPLYADAEFITTCIDLLAHRESKNIHTMAQIIDKMH